MNKHEDTIMVLTARSPSRIIREGGSQSWRLKPERAGQCTWLVCTQNQHCKIPNLSDATQPHRTGFLLGKISEIRQSAEENGDLWLIAISEYAYINYPDLWDRKKCAWRYTTLDALGISLKGIVFHPMP